MESSRIPPSYSILRTHQARRTVPRDDRESPGGFKRTYDQRNRRKTLTNALLAGTNNLLGMINESVSGREHSPKSPADPEAQKQKLLSLKRDTTAAQESLDNQEIIIAGEDPDAAAMLRRQSKLMSKGIKALEAALSRL